MRVGCEPAYEKAIISIVFQLLEPVQKVLHGADLIRLLKFITRNCATEAMIVWANVVAARPRDLGTAPHGTTLTNAKSQSRREA